MFHRAYPKSRTLKETLRATLSWNGRKMAHFEEIKMFILHSSLKVLRGHTTMSYQGFYDKALNICNICCPFQFSKALNIFFRVNFFRYVWWNVKRSWMNEIFFYCFKTTLERAIYDCRGFCSLMGIYECVVFTKFATL